MNNIIKQFHDIIMMQTHTDEEWIEIKRKVDDYLSSCSEEEEEEFTDSGIGEALYMSLPSSYF